MRTLPAIAGLAVSLALAALTYPVAAWGQPEPEAAWEQPEPEAAWNRGVARADRQEARALFLEGNRFFRIPVFPKAIERYRAAIAKWPHPRFYFNLAIAQSNNGDDVAARESLQRALHHGQEPLGADRYRRARSLLEEIESGLGRVRMTCGTPGATISVDGKRSFTCADAGDERTLWLAPGRHEMSAEKAGFLPSTRAVAAAAGNVTSVSISLVTLVEATDHSRRWAVWKPWSVIGGGLAVLAIGAGFHARAAANANAHDDRFVALPCVTEPDPTSPGCPPEDIPRDLQDLLDRAETQESIAVGLYIAGGAALAAGVVLQVLNRPGTLTRQEAESADSAVELTPILAPGNTVGMSMVLRFGGM